MREILFRGKSIISGEWVFGTPVCVEESTYPTDRVLLVRAVNYDELDNFMPQYESDEVTPETVGQFTGLYDRNGKRVFEGDALKFRGCSGELKKFPAVIRYGAFNCSCCDGVYGWYLEHGDIRDLDTEPLGNRELGYEIVGNIHDNPELD